MTAWAGTRPHIRLERCDCGLVPELKACRGGEDSMETWVECTCGIRGEEVEDAYRDDATAAHVWNRGERKPPWKPAEPHTRHGYGECGDRCGECSTCAEMRASEGFEE